ncbi:hypothetical protein FACHB389_35970 [Nostoc calcicola FACHB-389]|nr:hypothetical protein [Nostoc calcicola FACHB-3891]OKH14574.1 hypothetical protein FACHB389_35970 [Nostoc calcicola FACHB-389]
MTNKICSVAQGILEPDEGLTIELESPQWFEWLETQKSFRYCPFSSDSPFTVTREGEYWYGYRKQLGKLHKRYIGKSEKLTTAKLEEIASLLNVPPKPRSKNVEQSVPVTETTTNNNVGQLWQAITEVRDQLEELRGKLPAR